MKSKWLRLSLIVSIVLVISSCGGSSDGTVFVPSTPDPERISFAGIGSLGIFDPSIAKSPNESTLWMTYSYVDPASHFAQSQHIAVGVRLAYSDDNGNTWIDSGVALADFIDVTVGPLPNYPTESVILAGTNATWNNEVASLVYDPGASVAERWKLLWHQYLKANNEEYYFSFGWLAMKMAASPLELANTMPIKLFAGIGLRTESENGASPAFSPIAGAPEIQLHNGLSSVVSTADLRDLSACLITEPSLLATTTALYLTLDCHSATNAAESYTPIFKCDSPCTVTDSSAWQYLGRAADFNDAVALGRFKMNGPHLFEKNGSMYVILTPVEDTTYRRYDGCRIYRFSDIDTASLERRNGTLDEVKKITGTADSHHGACAYHPALQPGIIYGELVATDPPELFRIFQSFVTVP